MRPRKPGRSGYTTGACAAAAAKGAVLMLLGGNESLSKAIVDEVRISLPNGQRVNFKIERCTIDAERKSAVASVIKDAGDDPDVTNGAEIAASARFAAGASGEVIIRGGVGVGVVTRPGLPVPPGEPAINPVPGRMIREAVGEALKAIMAMKGKNKKISGYEKPAIEITISVPEGQKLARKTLNARLGIIGGLSILGTTGIVIPLSGAAWKASITAAMKVARAMGVRAAVLSAGRTSERAHMRKFHLPEAACVLMGDYVEFSLREAARCGFTEVNICAQWAKLVKIAMGTPDTHVRSGAIDLRRAVDFLRENGVRVTDRGVRVTGRPYNTAREIFDYVSGAGRKKVCAMAAAYGAKVSGLPVKAFLVSYEGDIIAQNV
ncbi:MAG: cobalt-precorrin-5B (C(1))-methyltransferase CbiD [Nitrospiraceae bacterium]|nr:cobalt-precorrin-5B (C(1))-methyltransferase CbiD [Nitrospiraceae bacterium]